MGEELTISLVAQIIELGKNVSRLENIVSSQQKDFQHLSKTQADMKDTVSEIGSQVRAIAARLNERHDVAIEDNHTIINNVGGDNTGRDKIGGDKNSDKTIKYLITSISVLAVVVVYMMYYMVMSTKAEAPEAPKIQQTGKM